MGLGLGLGLRLRLSLRLRLRLGLLVDSQGMSLCLGGIIMRVVSEVRILWQVPRYRRRVLVGTRRPRRSDDRRHPHWRRIRTGICAWRGCDAPNSRGGRERSVGGAFAPLDDRLLHGNGAVNAVQLVVQATGIARGIALLIAPPEWGVSSMAIDAHHTGSGARLTIAGVVLGLTVVGRFGRVRCRGAGWSHVLVGNVYVAVHVTASRRGRWPVGGRMRWIWTGG